MRFYNPSFPLLNPHSDPVLAWCDLTGIFAVFDSPEIPYSTLEINSTLQPTSTLNLVLYPINPILD